MFIIRRTSIGAAANGFTRATVMIRSREDGAIRYQHDRLERRRLFLNYCLAQFILFSQPLISDMQRAVTHFDWFGRHSAASKATFPVDRVNSWDECLKISLQTTITMNFLMFFFYVVLMITRTFTCTQSYDLPCWCFEQHYSGEFTHLELTCDAYFSAVYIFFFNRRIGFNTWYCLLCEHYTILCFRT